MRPLHLIRILIYCLLVQSAAPLSGQQLQPNGHRSFSQDSLRAIEYFNIADTSWKNVDSCLYYSHLAIPLLKKTGQWEKYVHCLAGRSYCYNVKEQYDSMEVNNRLAYEEAQRYLAPNSYLYIAVINNLGIVYSNVRQDYKQAILHYQTALNLFDNTNTHDAVKGTILKNIGDIYLKSGDFDRAIVHFKEALAHFERAFRSYVNKNAGSYFKIAEVYQSLARVYQYQRNYAEATRYLREMLVLMGRNTRDFNTGYFAYCYTQLAEIALEQKELANAADYLQQAGGLTGLTPQQRAETSRLYGQLYLAEGHLGMAHHSTDLALQLMPASKLINRAAILHIKGQVLYEEGHYEEALHTLSSAAGLLTAGAPFSIETAKLDPALQIFSRIDLIDQLQAMARCLEALHQQQRNIQRLHGALNCYLLISALSDQLRSNYQSEESKIFLSETTYPFFEQGIALAYHLFQITQERTYIDHAFFLSEKSKAAVLLEEIRAKEATGVFTIPGELIEKDYQLRTDLNYYRKLLGKEEKNTVANPDKLKDWNGKLLEIIRQREQLQVQIALDYPNYSTLIRSEIPRLSDLQEDLSSRTAAIEYFLARDSSYAFFITPERVEIRKIAGGEVLTDQIETLMGLLKMDNNEDLSKFQNAAHQLYRELLGAFDISNIKKLTIIPHGSLSYLPFEILLPTQIENGRPRQLDYLLKKHTVGYAYSLALWHLQQQSIHPGGKILILSPVFPQDPVRYLRFSEEKISALDRVQYTSLQYEEATIDNFLKYAPEFDLIHLSTHATAGDSIGKQPAIDFFDDQLYLSDLYTMNLSADLVVLSACQTGTGNLRYGEGVMSLARGFTYAGVPSVMTTLWKVNEKATSTIVQDFYKNLSALQNKDEALRQAKLNYLEYCADIKSTPYFWAGFVLIGNTHTFTFEKKAPYLGTVSISIFILVILFILLRTWIRG